MIWDFEPLHILVPLLTLMLSPYAGIPQGAGCEATGRVCFQHAHQAAGGVCSAVVF